MHCSDNDDRRVKRVNNLSCYMIIYVLEVEYYIMIHLELADRVPMSGSLSRLLRCTYIIRYGVAVIIVAS